LPDYFNYFTASAPSEGIKNVRQYSKITYKNIYPGIDLEFFTNKEHGYKYNFVIYPEANINDIQLRIEGPESVSLIRDTLKFGTRFGDLEELIPESYYIVNDSRVTIRSRFKKINDEVYGFSVDTAIPSNSMLVIDPTPKRLWGTYYGGENNDVVGQCSTDKAGNVFLYGMTNSLVNIASAGSYQGILAGETDCFLAKFDAAGLRQWGTYFGGISKEQASNTGGLAIAVDESGNIYFAGSTSSLSGIATPGAHQTIYGGGDYDCFLEKFSQAGYRIWGTYYGGAMEDRAEGITTDMNGNVFLAGDTRSTSGIATAGSYQPVLFNAGKDAFFAKFDSNGVRQWGTYYGGEMDEWATSCATDGSGHVYFAGWTISQTNIASPGAFQTIYGGGASDGFLAKFNTGGQRVWATYYGGESDDGGGGCIVDSAGNLCMAGGTASLAGIASTGCHQPVYGGGAKDGFIVKFDSSGQRLWGTYYGGSSYDLVSGCAFGWNGDIFVAGYSSSVNNISTPDAYQSTLNAYSDAFLVKFNAAGQRQWGSYYGGSKWESFYTCSYVTDDTLYAAGVTTSTDSMASPGAWQQSYGGGLNDCILIKFLDCWPIIAGPISGPDTLCLPSNGVNYSIPPLIHAMNYIWTLPPGFILTSGAGSANITIDISNSAGSGTIWVKGLNKCGDPGDSASLYITISLPPVPVISGPDTTCAGTGKVYTTAPGNTNYQWSVSAGGVITAGGTTLDNSVTVTWNTAGTQHVYVNYTDANGCNASTPTDYIVQVISSPAVVSVNVSASQNPVCQGVPVTLTAIPSNGGSLPVYQWLVNGSGTGADTSVITFVPGNGDQVICILTSNLPCVINNTASDTIVINTTDPHKLIDTTLCYGTPYFAQGAWQTTGGAYYDTLVNPVSCIRFIETHLSYKPSIQVDLGNDTILCGNPITLSAYFPGGTYVWQDGSNDSHYVVTLPGEYSVLVGYDGCVNSDSIKIGECSVLIWFPNAFTPNSDGLNDTFHPIGNGIEKFSMQIFNRWGTMVFETTSPGTGWDGTYKGSPCPEETYVFKASFEISAGEVKQVTGTITLKR
jgi:gliding motility-associated-like protein